MFIAKEYTDKLNRSSRLSDEDALCMYIWYVNNVCNNEIAFIKNSRCEFIAFTEPAREEFDFSPEMLGTTFYAAANIPLKIRQDIHEQESRLLEDRIVQKSFYFYQKNNEIRHYLVRKRALINPDTNHVVGIQVNTERFFPNLHRKFLQREFLGISDQLQDNSRAVLTPIQKQILFCLLIGISNRKEIAQTLTSITSCAISEVKIKNELQVLYHRFNCSYSSQLIQLVLSEQTSLDLSELPISPGNYLL